MKSCSKYSIKRQVTELETVILLDTLKIKILVVISGRRNKGKLNVFYLYFLCFICKKKKTGKAFQHV